MVREYFKIIRSLKVEDKNSTYDELIIIEEGNILNAIESLKDILKRIIEEGLQGDEFAFYNKQITYLKAIAIDRNEAEKFLIMFKKYYENEYLTLSEILKKCEGQFNE